MTPRVLAPRGLFKISSYCPFKDTLSQDFRFPFFYEQSKTVSKTFSFSQRFSLATFEIHKSPKLTTTRRRKFNRR